MRWLLLSLFAACSYAPKVGDNNNPIEDGPIEDGPVDTSVGNDTQQCNPSDEVCNGAVDEDCDTLTDCGDTACTATPFCCVGSPDGPVHTIQNTCVTNDFGTSGSSDDLEVYCCGGQARFCLSKEACPWRAGCPAGNTKTCSRAGLPGTAMATADCDLWKGQTSYGCSLDEQITFP